MKYFLQLVFIYSLCLSFNSPMVYAQTEVLREPRRLTEDVLFLEHNSGETGGVLILTVRGDHIDQDILYRNIHLVDDQQDGDDYLNPIRIDPLTRNNNGRLIDAGRRLFFDFREEKQVHRIFIYGTSELLSSGDDVTVALSWTAYRLVGDAEQDVRE